MAGSWSNPFDFFLFLVLLKHKYECLFCLCDWSALGLGRVPWPGRRWPLEDVPAVLSILPQLWHARLLPTSMLGIVLT